MVHTQSPNPSLDGQAKKKDEGLYVMTPSTSTEIATVIEDAKVMAAHYRSHYPVLEKYIDSYVESCGGFLANQPQPPNSDWRQSLETRVDLAIASGFYYMSPVVALFMIQQCPHTFINDLSSYIKNPNIAWQRVLVQQTFMVTCIVGICLEKGDKNPFACLNRLVDEVPIPEDIKDELRQEAMGYLNARLEALPPPPRIN